MSAHAVGQRWHTAVMTDQRASTPEPRGGKPSQGTSKDKRKTGNGGAKPGPKPGKK